MMNRALNEINYALIHVLNTEDDHLIPGNLFHFFHALIHVLNTEDDEMPLLRLEFLFCFNPRPQHRGRLFHQIQAFPVSCFNPRPQHRGRQVCHNRLISF